MKDKAVETLKKVSVQLESMLLEIKETLGEIQGSREEHDLKELRRMYLSNENQ